MKCQLTDFEYSDSDRSSERSVIFAVGAELSDAEHDAFAAMAPWPCVLYSYTHLALQYTKRAQKRENTRKNLLIYGSPHTHIWSFWVYAGLY